VTSAAKAADDGVATAAKAEAEADQ